MCNVAGDIELPLGGRYRILGMRPVRDELTSHDYDVIRIWGKDDGVRYISILTVSYSIYRIPTVILLESSVIR